MRVYSFSVFSHFFGFLKSIWQTTVHTVTLDRMPKIYRIYFTTFNKYLEKSSSFMSWFFDKQMFFYIRKKNKEKPKNLNLSFIIII